MSEAPTDDADEQLLSPGVMRSLDQLRIGSVRYLNALPLLEPYEKMGGRLRLEHPSALAAALAAGELDVALVPIYEALRSPECRLVDGVAIGARGPVWSVFVAHREATPEAIDALALDPASLTSANLCRVLFKEMGREPRIIPFPEATPETARLLIGDQANAFRAQEGDRWHYYDLGEAWLGLTGLPFVFAAWVMRPEVEEPEEKAAAFRSLAAVGRSRIARIAAAQEDADFALRYLSESLRYDLGSEEKQGVARFRERLIHHGQLPPSDAPIRWV